MWELQGERLIGAAGCVSGAQKVFEKTLQYAQERTAFGRQSQVPGYPPQVRRDGDQDRERPPDGLHHGLAPSQGEYPWREISMAKLHASRVAVEVATSASRSTAAPAT